MLRATSFTLRDPNRLIIDVVGDTDIAIPAPVEPARRITEAVPNSSPTPSQPSLPAAAASATTAESKTANVPVRQTAATAQPNDRETGH
jgi:hypothetical protein